MPVSPRHEPRPNRQALASLARRAEAARCSTAVERLRTAAQALGATRLRAILAAFDVSRLGDLSETTAGALLTALESHDCGTTGDDPVAAYLAAGGRL